MISPLRFLTDLVFPPVCILCGAYMQHPSDLVCGSCWEKAEKAQGARCERCFELLDGKKESCLCRFHWPYAFSSIRSGWLFCEPIQKILHQLKYSGKSRLGYIIGQRLAVLVDKNYFQGMEWLVPVPLHHTRFRERGYNQSFYIAKGLQPSLNIPIQTKIIKRRKRTKTQTKLTREERSKNVENIFSVLKSKKSDLANRRILMVDDVYTTGATADECARILMEAGAAEVKVLTAAGVA